MNDVQIKNAVIKSAEISIGDSGFLECWLSLEFGHGGQGFGGYCLYLPKSFNNHGILSVAGHHIFRIMEIASVSNWSDLKGKTIRIKGTHLKIDSIGHIIKEDWYCPSDDFKKAKNN